MKVKPVDPNAVIRDPITKLPLPAEGAEVPDNTFWNRRLLAKEVELVKDVAQPIVNAPIAPLNTRKG